MPAPDATATFLVRYGEIGIKSLPVRRRFERLLADNLLRGLKARGAQGTLRPTWGRLFLEAPEAPGRDTVRRTFGVVSFSPVVRAPRELPALAAFVAERAAALPPAASFAIRARRTGDPGYTSQEAARALGTAVLEAHRARGLRVDLDAPAAEIIVEVRDDAAWVAFESVPGPGGLPVGSEGRVTAWLATPRDACAVWLAMKRGCRVDLLGPQGADAEALARRLAAWDGGIELTEVPPTADRGLVLALLAAHARRRKASAVVVGDGFQDALATARLDRTIGIPVFRPLLALEPPMLDAIAGDLDLKVEGAPAVDVEATDPAAHRQQAEELLKGSRRRRVMP